MPSHFTIKNFIGRDHEFGVLKRLHAEAASGDATSIFLSGRNGMGKTELMRHAYYHFFSGQKEVVPFFYTIKTAHASVENFSRDYFCSFVIQCLAFLRSDLTMLDACIYSREDVLRLAGESGVQWMPELIKAYDKSVKESDPLNQFLATISLPYSFYLLSGMPVIVMIDDFHKMRKFSEINMKDMNRELWVLFETPVRSRHTPHIFSGNQAELNRMFFEDTLFGEYLELFNLPSLRNHDAVRLVKVLCETYGLDVRMELSDVIELLGGSPYYIRNFVQAARQSSGVLSEENFWFVYLSEITKGKTFRYWTSILKTYIPQYDLRKPSLRFLHHLLRRNEPGMMLSDIPEDVSLSHEQIEQIINQLHTSGVVETGFSEIELAEDRILSDIIRCLYTREIEKRPWNSIKEKIISDSEAGRKTEKRHAFSLSIPAKTTAQLVAVKTLEYIAEHFELPVEISRQLQMALADLFTNVIGQMKTESGHYTLSFNFQDNIFQAVVEIPQQNILLSDGDHVRIRTYLDSLRMEDIAAGTRITLLKEVRKDPVSLR